MVLKCRPFFLAREHTVVYICAVYIPPDANSKLALALLQDCIQKCLRTHPDCVFISAGDFNHANLKTVMPKFHRNITCATRGDKTLDQVYTNVAKAYKAKPDPHLDLSDHISLFLYPMYVQKIKSARPTTRTVRIWPEGAVSRLEDCFEMTDWDTFMDSGLQVDPTAALDSYTSTVMHYITFCMDMVTVTKKVRSFPNQKPWLTAEVRSLLRARDAAYRSGDATAYSIARSALRSGIKAAKLEYRQRIETHFSNSDPRRVWEGIRAMSDYKGTPSPVNSSAPLAEELNQFYARFDSENRDRVVLPLPPGGNISTLSHHDVRCCLRNTNPRKAAGPDGVVGRILKECADQLTEVFTEIFNLSLSLSHVPLCFKSSTIIPVPKQAVATCLNDYRPVALTSLPSKCLERLVMKQITSIIPDSFDPHQFAYRRNRSTEDAIAIVLHSALEHLENKNSYVRLLFIDYSSAFNTILPRTLISKLHSLGLSNALCNWVLSFLTNRTQAVRLGNYTSSTLSLSTGAPQGCVLSPLLYTLLTHDCSPTLPSNYIIKFADDTTVVGLITNNDESAYRREVEALVAWCARNNLSLNIKKTREIITDFRRNRPAHAPLLINSEAVERVSEFKFLGLRVSEELSWSSNTTSVLGKAQQRLYFLRKLKREGLPKNLLINFYHCAVESVLTYCMSVWFSSCTKAEQEALQRVVKVASRIIGSPLPPLLSVFTSRCLRRSKSIIKDRSHPAHHLFHPLPSGRRYRSIRTKSTRFLNSFFPQAVRLLNNQ